MQNRFDTALESLSSSQERLSGILLAVSGGVDSMVMLSLAASSPVAGRIAVAHMNFSLRGEESDGDEAMVRSWCESRGIPFFVKRVETRAYASDKGISVEMAARELRYSWFEELLESEILGCVAVAHNMNDSVETVFLNLLRGTGLRGVTGIRKRNGSVIRPMLEFTREGILQYASEHGIPFRTDSTNLESEFARNRIRNEVFPQFEKINPSFLRNVAASAAHFALAEAFMKEKLSEEESSFVCREDASDAELEINSAALARDPHRSLRLYSLLEEYGFNEAQIESVVSALESQPGRKFAARDHTLVTAPGCLRLYTDSVSENDDITFPVKVSVMLRPSGFDPRKAPPGTLYADADKLSFPLGFRRWMVGDRFRPFGMKGFKKLSDFFNDLGLDLEQKRREVIVTTCIDGSEQIVCIAGRRLDDRFKVTEATERIAVISII
ncbi:MAG: tRNA lysidine(34) synthetase TilS [Bacteroidales bacterium]|nr:tRNA lysidine(34) synthetase TilS [Bacteroidales bacterium]